MITTSTLPAAFYRDAAPTPVTNPTFVLVNNTLAAQLGLGQDFFEKSETLSALSGNTSFENQTPRALAYAGHQFGNWVPLLGDGRAHLIATLKTPAGESKELQLKGSGPSPFSRNGDGRAALGPMLREYIISEAMAGLGIPTTRSLAVVTTGEQVYRRQREPGAIVARIAKSHVRVGTFQFAASLRDIDNLRQLADHEIARSYPDAPTGDDRYLWFLRSAISRQAQLIARWMQVGFIHGVMNTDNMAISGETIDYGPCAFMDTFHPKKTFSSIDSHGRYAWDQQSAIALWNLTRLAESLLPLFASEQEKAIALATAELEAFNLQFETAFETGILHKMGITERLDGDDVFIASTLTSLMQGEVDYTLFFSNLTRIAQGQDPHALLALFNDQTLAKSWLVRWRARLDGNAPDVSMMKFVNPVYIARNHQVEAALQEAEQGNLARAQSLCARLQNPFVAKPSMASFEAAPLPEEIVGATFCGT